MAEAFFKFQDTRTSSPSRSFNDFEEEWIQLGEDLAIAFESGNSPKDPYKTSKNESKKRKISETEDSLIIARRKMAKKGHFTQQKSEEDPILKTFRQENPKKFKALEKRTRCTFTLESSSPGSTPAAPGFIDFLPPPDHKLTPQKTACAQVVPTYSPASPEFLPSDHTLTTQQAAFSQVVPTYSPASPEFNIDSLPSDHTLTPLQAAFAHSTTSSGCEQATSTRYSKTGEDTQYPLQKELGALAELVDSLRVDLLQTSTLVNYVQDYVKKTSQ